MKKLEYTVQFVTPAFLGNAEQNTQWRTPPFKTMLRQWWRVLKAKEANYNASILRIEEGDIYGSAASDSDSSQSRVRIRLSSWSAGTLKEWPADPTTPHKEVRGGMAIGSHLYLGYGPLISDHGTKLKNNAAIQENEKADFSVITDDKYCADMMKVMQLAHWFGTLGGRSRNAWGSASFSAKIHDELMPFEALVSSSLITGISLPLESCFKHDWPHAIGIDDQGILVWQARQSYGNWSEAMKELARIKIAFRVGLGFQSGENAAVEARHIIAYPVTKHSTRDFDRNARLPNQLRFKVHKTAAGEYLPTAFHFPVKTPEVVGKSLPVIEQISVWKTVHRKLDELMIRIAQ